MKETQLAINDWQFIYPQKVFLKSLVCNKCVYLLYISVCGLPHVVILNNTRQGLPGQLERKRGHKIIIISL